MSESAVLFGTTNSLVGIVTDPPETAGGNTLPAILFLNDGLIHRVGPHRLYVKMARDLAALGFVVLRFDFSGVGDSDVRRDNLPFEKSAVHETQEAMSFLSTTRGIERFILMGMCSGALRALQTACGDPRVVGAALLNIPRLSTESSQESHAFFRNRSAARGYWKKAVFRPSSWGRAILGKTDYRRIMTAVGYKLRSLLTRTRKRVVSSMATQTLSELRGLTERDVRLLLAYAEDNLGLDYLRVILGEKLHELTAHGKLRVEIIPHAEETFALRASQEHLLKIVANWAQVMVQD